MFVARVRTPFTPGAEGAGKPSQGARPGGRGSTRPGGPWSPGSEGEGRVGDASAQLTEGEAGWPNADDPRSGRPIQTLGYSGERRREGFPRRRSGPKFRAGDSWLVLVEFENPRTRVRVLSRSRGSEYEPLVHDVVRTIPHEIRLHIYHREHRAHREMLRTIALDFLCDLCVLCGAKCASSNS